MINFNKHIQKNFKRMCQTGMLFRANITGRELWHLYLDSFEDGHDPMFRDPESSEHNCNHCNNFVRRYGNIVAIGEDGELMTLFDVHIHNEFSYEYMNPALKLSTAIYASGIKDVFFETRMDLNKLPYEKLERGQELFRLGINKNVKRYTREEAEKFGVVKPNEIRTFNHMFLDLPKEFVSNTSDSVEQITSFYRDKHNVFKRAIEEYSVDTLNTVEDLILQGSLLDGTAHLPAIKKMKAHLIAFNSKTSEHINKDNYFWKVTYNMEERIAKFRNTLIGVLCSELEEGLELVTVCTNWNKRVDPANYMKATAPITKRQIEDAQKFLIENNYEESFNRRHACIDDISASEIKHLNGSGNAMKSFSIFDKVAPTVGAKKLNFDYANKIAIEDFMEKILPNAESLEVYLENRMSKNMVNLTTSVNPESKKAFKWDNNFSWTMNGNLAGISLIQQAVKDAGGKINGVLRFSISWNEDGRSICDFDAHCYEPNRNLIYYGNKIGMFGGKLDVDMIRPSSMGVENIVYPSLERMVDGTYRFRIHNYDGGKNTGFKAQIEFDGEIFDYEVTKDIHGTVDIAQVTLKNGKFDIQHFIPHTSSSREIYGLDTNNFHKVNLMCLSPNHWGENNIGNKYYFFMLDGCKTSDKIRSFHVENLNKELADHRKVMEVVGTTNLLEPYEDQLAGVGFNSTIKDSVIVKVNNKELYNVVF